MVRVLWVLIFVCVLALAGIAGIATAKASSDGGLFSGSSDTDDTMAAIQNMLPPVDSDDPTAAKSDGMGARVAAFYAARDFKPVWSGNDDADQRAKIVRDALENAYEQGLRSGDYTKALAEWDDKLASGQDAARYDIALTHALFRYALDVRLGRVKPADVYKDVNLPQQDFDVGAAFAQALRHDEIEKFLADLPPQHPGYRGLVLALAQYRVIAARGGWSVIPDGTTLENGGHGLEALAQRLAFEDEVLADTPEPTDADVREALLRFQRRMGLEDDGKIGVDTRKALNTPVSVRVKQIVVNMERWRWLPRGFERRYVYVNVPDESLDFVENRKSLLHSRVIIGKKTTPTPIMRTTVQAVVANPTWDIPDDLAAKKLLPNLRRDANYLASRNMVVAGGPSGDPHGNKVDWKRVKPGALPYQIQQNPGGDNALGTIMLDMPNDFDVYLHDTPDKKLFRSTMREVSNGCIRVEEIFALASLTLQKDPDQNDDLQQAISSGETQRLELPEPLPVYVLYWTAMANSDGEVGFRPDRYGRDAPLIAALTGSSHDHKATTVVAKAA